MGLKINYIAGAQIKNRVARGDLRKKCKGQKGKGQGRVLAGNTARNTKPETTRKPELREHRR